MFAGGKFSCNRIQPNGGGPDPPNFGKLAPDMWEHPALGRERRWPVLSRINSFHFLLQILPTSGTRRDEHFGLFPRLLLLRHDHFTTRYEFPFIWFSFVPQVFGFFHRL